MEQFLIDVYPFILTGAANKMKNLVSEEGVMADILGSPARGAVSPLGLTEGFLANRLSAV